MKKVFVSVAMATMFTSTVLACDPVATGGYTVNYTTNNIVNNYGINYGSMDIYSNSGSGYQEVNSYAYTDVSNYCGICGLTWDACTCYDGGSSGCAGYDRTGDTYYDSQGHLCTYGGYWEGGQWITTVGYYENGEWCPAQYDPALEVGYYDEAGNYYSYYGCSSTSNLTYAWNRSENTAYYAEEGGCYQYGETDVWAADNPWWLEANGCGNPLYCDYETCSDYEGCDSGDYYIDVDVNAGVINLVNNGTIIISSACSCNPIYQGQELAFTDQKCSGIWNQCSGFYEFACGYVSDCPVICH